MPQMDPARWRAASLRLDEALELTGDQTPDGLHRLLKEDLDTIVGKALEKNPAERYPSVGDLAEDLRPPSQSPRFR
jgi:hypothetical protein